MTERERESERERNRERERERESNEHSHVRMNGKEAFGFKHFILIRDKVHRK